MRLAPTLLSAGLVASTLTLILGASAGHAQSLPAGVRAGASPTVNLGPVGEGRRAWLKFNCYGCHGNNAAGGMGPNVQGAEAGDVIAAMLQGDATEGGMRSFNQYATRTDAQNIVAYLNAIGTKAEPTWLDWWNPVP
jgi:mono/diheme cytochrome c family protein